MGRAFAVSMGLNFIGYPIGASLAGAVAAVSLEAAIVVGAVACVAASIAAVVLIPRRVPDARRAAAAAGRAPHGDAADVESRTSVL
jgi:hypothetical protein